LQLTLRRTFASTSIATTTVHCTVMHSVQRLNHLLILNTHQDLLDLEAVARNFVALNDYRRNLFDNRNF